MTNILPLSSRVPRFGAAALILISLTASCTRNQDTSHEPAVGGQNPTDVRIDRRMFDSPNWIDIHDPDRSASGFTLVLYKRRVPMLIDMNGEVVHAWHGVRAVGRARLSPAGNLVVIGESGDLEEYDWEGRKTWNFTLPDTDTFLHHDFIQLENENFLVLAYDPSAKADFLLEVDRSGEIRWRWDANQHLEHEFQRSSTSKNRTHINSLHELPPNRWFDKGLEAFRPGNILISARNLNTIYIVARPGGEVVWQHDDGLDYQHEAIMIPPGIQGAGNILLFNNGYHNLNEYRHSAVIEINPVEGAQVWKYRGSGFYSSTGGTQQSLPNGNLLVTSSQGGRIFELTRDGRIVWQWSPPFKPMRASRYPENHCPQLEELDAPSKEPLERRDPDRFVDEDLYAFSLPHETQRVKLANKSRYILKNPNRCQILRIPPGAELVLGFGAWTEDPETPYVADEGPAQFLATLRIVDRAQTERVLDRSVEKSSLKTHDAEAKVALVNEKIPLESFYDQSVELCLSLGSSSGGSTTGAFVWEEPLLRSPIRRAAMEDETEIDAETLEKQEKHLKAIGYIN